MEQSKNAAYNHLQITQKIRSLGREMSPVTMAAMELFIPFHELPPYIGVRFEQDIAYGTDPRNLLDLCTSGTVQPGDKRDILVFLHGGGFVRGDKKLPDSPYHDNVALWVARNGMIGVNMTYRLAPEHMYPSGIEDVAAVVQWLHQNAESYEGDADRIFLFGSSAGAIHIAYSWLLSIPPIAFRLPVWFSNPDPMT